MEDDEIDPVSGIKRRGPPGAWMEPFLAALEVEPFIAEAARRVGVHRSRPHQLMRADPEFLERVREAQRAAYDSAQKEAWRRAVKGYTKGVWHNGVRVGEETVYSDTLLVRVLQAKVPEEYKDRVEMTGADGGPLIVDDTAKQARVAALMALSAAREQIDKAADDLA